MRQPKDIDEKLEKEKAELKKQIKDMSFAGKLEYFITYYKWVIALAVLAVFLTIGGVDWYKSMKIETVLTVQTVHAVLPMEQAEETIREQLGIQDEKDKQVLLLSPLSMDGSGELDYYSQMSLITKIAANDLDVMLMPEDYARNMERDGYFADPSTYLTPEQQESLKDQIDGCCIVLPGGEKMQMLGLYDDPVYCGVIVNTRNPDYAAEWVLALAESDKGGE
ncbi:MAG: hypothetical protein IIY55_10950 [Blautia sp.]|nr:hypothetical protein [Blautia sp.]